MKIAVAGTGYVGLVTGVCLASKGHHVWCVDVAEDKIRMMQQGKSPIYEEGLEELMQTCKDHLVFTTDYASAYKDADVIFIGVGTPEKRDGSANLTYVYTVADQIAELPDTDLPPPIFYAIAGRHRPRAGMPSPANARNRLAILHTPFPCTGTTYCPSPTKDAKSIPKAHPCTD